MSKSVLKNGNATRQLILDAALKRFADGGYAATSIQQIVGDARVSKPALYYHFSDKAGLFQALVDRAHDERFELMQAAARRGRTVPEKLVEIVSAVFDFSVRNRELMRLAFATAFAAPGEMPLQRRCREKGIRSFEFVLGLIEEGQAAGELGRHFSPEDLAMGMYGLVNTYVMVGVVLEEFKFDRSTAERVIALFLQGAGVSKQRASSRISKPVHRN